MADVVTRLVVESKEYDSKIARATAGLTQFEKKFREVGGTLEYVEKEDLEYVKALGQMETVSNSATGSLAELKKAFTELSVQYKNLTDEEKKSPYGQALAGSLDQIKGRIGDLSGQLGEVGKEMQTSGGFVDKFADSLSQLGPIGQMAGKLLKGAFGPVGIAIAAVVGVIQQLVAAFKRNENAMASAERAAAPFKAIWQQIQRLFDKLVPHIANGMEKIANIFQSIVNKITGWIGDLGQTWIGKKLGLDDAYESLKKFREEQNKLADDNKKIANSELALTQLQRKYDQSNSTSRAKISDLRYKASDKSSYSAEERVGFLEEAMKEEEKILKRNIELRTKEYELIKLKNSLTQSGTEDLNAENAALIAITDARTEYNNQMRTMQRQLQSAKNESAKEASGVGGGSKQDSAPVVGSLGDWEQQAANVREYMKGATSTEEYKELQTDLDFILSKIKEIQGAAEVAFAPGSLNDLNQQLSEAQSILASLAPNTEEWANALQDVADKQAAVNALQEQINNKGGSGVDNAKNTADAWQNAVAAVNNVGSALQQIEDPAAKVAGIIAAAVAQVALAFASSLKGAVGPWDYIAAATAGLATMISTITAIKSITANAKGYAEGGMVGGNSYSGDNIVARLNSGEGVLTAQGVQNAANMANGLSNGGGGGSSQPYLTGDVILLGVNNYLGRSGQGEIVTTSMLRRAGVNL